MRDYRAWAAWIAARAAVPFGFAKGQQDCMRFAGGAVAALTACDPLAGLSWSSELGAARMLRRLGGMEVAIGTRLRLIAPAKAHRGDIAGVREDGDLRIMVIEGPTLVAPAACGLRRAHRDVMIIAWSAD